MERYGDYTAEIEIRACGAPKYRVTVTLGGKNVGTDYAATERQAEQLAVQMIRRHQQLHRPSYQTVISANG